MEGGPEEGQGEVSAVDEWRPSTLRALRALTARELKKWLKEPVVLMIAVAQPIVWMALFGKAMNLSAVFSASALSSAPVPDAIPIPGSYAIPPVEGVLYVSGAWPSQASALASCGAPSAWRTTSATWPSA